MMENKFIDYRLDYPSTKRNRNYIAKILSSYIPSNGFILEIASGSGEHGVFFQQLFPSMIWQTSDPNPRNRKSICSWIKYKNLSNSMPNPLNINVENKPWPLTPEFKSLLKGIVCINMLHISPWSCTLALFEQAGLILSDDQFLFIYGPFIVNHKQTSQSNLVFDKSLKLQNPFWGIRNLESVNDVALSNGFTIENILEMPANNLSIVYKRIKD